MNFFFSSFRQPFYLIMEHLKKKKTHLSLLHISVCFSPSLPLLLCLPLPHFLPLPFPLSLSFSLLLCLTCFTLQIVDMAQDPGKINLQRDLFLTHLLPLPCLEQFVMKFPGHTAFEGAFLTWLQRDKHPSLDYIPLG